MTGRPRLRLATEADVEPIARLAGEVFSDLAARLGRPEHFPSPPSEPIRSDRLHRHAHLLATDPALQWVAEDGGALVGAACGLEREGLWGLSLLVVHPRAQGAGLGRALLERAGSGATRGLICSSDDPAALRCYAMAGFDLLPEVELSGRLRRDALPAGEGVRGGSVGDLDHVAAIDRRVRGAAHGADWLVALRSGARLLVAERGYALAGPAMVLALAAEDEESATALLAAALRATDPEAERVTVNFVTAAEAWAVRLGVAVGLAPVPRGAVFVRGPRFAGPYLPSGAFL